MDEPGPNRQLIVHYTPGAVPMLNRSEYSSRASISLGRRWITLHDVESGNAEEVADSLRSRSDVLFVEENHRVTYAFNPNDTYFPGNGRYNSSRSGLVDQWGLTSIGCPNAWDLTQRRGGAIVVAIVDTGLDGGHPDLSRQLLRDAQGRVVGYNTLENTSNFRDENGHGTHVAGIAAGHTNNALGIAGVAFATARIMPVKALDAQGSGSDYAVAQGIVWAADHGANIISMSLGGSFYSQTTQMAVNYAWTKGCILVAAAGNDGRMKLNYPAGCNLAIGVAATEPDGAVAAYSNSGRHVDCASPGSDYLSTMPTYPVTLTAKFGFRQNYDALNGTSMATPVVSGLLALMWATYPTATNDQLRKLLTQTSEKLKGDGPGWLPTDGYGQVNADRAVHKARSNTGMGCLTGQVVNAMGLPIAGVTVAAGTKSYTTEDDGMFRLENMPSGTEHTIKATAQAPSGTKTSAVKAYTPDTADADITIVMK